MPVFRSPPLRPLAYSPHKPFPIQFLLESVITEYMLSAVTLNVLDISRTFIDKIMSVKRHAICGTITEKARHIYDVTRLFQMSEIQGFLENKEELKHLMVLTKQTDSAYLQKRNLPKEYDPTGAFAFSAWQSEFMAAKTVYERLHKDLLYTDQPQKFDEAVKTFWRIDSILQEIGE